MAQQAYRMTAADLATKNDDRHRYELVKGELREMAPACGGHGYQAMSFGARLYNFVEEHRLGYVFASETGFALQNDPDTVRAPDVAFVRAGRITESMLTRGFLPLAPDLAVEIISPSETAEEIAEKVQDYLAAGTEQVWLVYNRTRSIVVHRQPGLAVTLHVDNVLEGGDLLPGFRLPLREIFKE